MSDQDLVIRCENCRHTWLMAIRLPVLVTEFCAAVPKSCPACTYRPRTNARTQLVLLTGKAREEALKTLQKEARP